MKPKAWRARPGGDSAGRLYAAGDAGSTCRPLGQGTRYHPDPAPRDTLAFAGPDKHTLYIGAMGAVGLDDQIQTPKDVHKVPMTSTGEDAGRAPANKPSKTFPVDGRR